MMDSPHRPGTGFDFELIEYQNGLWSCINLFTNSTDYSVAILFMRNEPIRKP
jgi:hypothetical protein